ncbi:uncharacterized protein LOC123315474 [Coccinella septempunctata]|uniref:uncharacterized protein LOC123315474 n=1 Tax=Coccinella septempunctata TaxID=41139 RepID=UPI001D05C5B7|nr:uncharacterized protein LOC123315474 [Coccinella septempunctata]
MSDKLGALREYDIHSDWTIYNRRLESYFKANGIEDNEKKRAILLNSLNEEAYKLMYNLCMPVVPENKQYNELTSIFDEHFKSSLSPFAARYKFYNSVMDAHETVANWAARVRSLAGQCEFGSTVYDWVLRDRFIIGFEKGPIQDRLFEEKITCSFSDVITIASSKMAAQKNSYMEEVKIEPGLHHISQNPRTPSTAQNRSVMSDSGASGSGVQNRRKKCTVCGRRNHFTSDCRFKDYTCNVCNEVGHLARLCPNREHQRNGPKRFQNFIEVKDDFFNLTDTKSINQFNEPFFVHVYIDEFKHRFQLDSGASVSAVSYSFWLDNLRKYSLSKAERSL